MRESAGDVYGWPIKRLFFVLVACASSMLASPVNTTLVLSEQREPSCQPEVSQREGAGVKRTGLGAVYADGGCPEAALFERTFFSFASLSAARCADMELGCSAIPSRLLACGSEDSEQARLGSEMSCSGAMAELEDERDEPDLVDMAQGNVVCSRGLKRGCGRVC
ncbi:uncharacterized protein PHACADRAFT_259542 [Phanerochaete carnosa HHB-10118-sp]|uniref:Uncharacterized protein n=1 Tax=Phanerochaete carnosa (strain HHB-10118-sp) TaxID=650164 RepID=K5WSC8_PHACS|nr:uncharacterized protein PHACADRAFT_259542 [Phanerochaete carnosa HHB-10118-sp]EKM53287.1 hypothetical protein PHACADRAFT_259542 [Phanerochaete carnosa HHB-10118-sp]